MFLPSNITLKFGDSGDFVAELQRRLVIVGNFNGDAVNGFYDGLTVNAVTQFQGSHGLHADGVAGPETLRRLNGVIAGDTGSSTSSPTEEEEKQASLHAQHVAYDNFHQPAPEAWPTAPVAEEPAPAPQAPEIAAPVWEPPPPAAPTPTMLDPTLFAAPQPEPAALAPGPSSSDALAAMLGISAAAPAAVALAPEQPLPPTPAAPMMVATATAPIAPEAEPTATAVAATTPERTGIVGRVTRFANAAMEKLANYFEAKLPPSVLKEVQQIGVTMAQQGMKEAPMPTGPEFGGREQLPARGPEQQQGQQRG
jgi:peptidoglycan hydrolase-like protein with peptidoglycan-binding domain